MADTAAIEKSTLREAIERTIAHRNTSLEQSASIFTDEFKRNENLNDMWTAFLKRTRLDPATFPETIDKIQEFVQATLMNSGD